MIAAPAQESGRIEWPEYAGLHGYTAVLQARGRAASMIPDEQDAKSVDVPGAVSRVKPSCDELPAGLESKVG